MKKTILTMSALLAVATVSQAALISPTNTVLYTGAGSLNGGTTFVEVPGSHEIANTFDLTGIQGGAPLTTASIHDPYTSATGGRIRNANAGGGGHQASIILNLGGAFEIDGLALWNGNENDNRSTVTVANRDKTGRGWASAVVFTSIDNGANWVSQGSYSFTRESFDDLGYAPGDTPAPGDFIGATGDVTAQVKSWTAVAGVTDIRLDITNHGGGNIINYNEIGVSAIPEPATLGMVAVFGGGILFIRRRFMI